MSAAAAGVEASAASGSVDDRVVEGTDEYSREAEEKQKSAANDDGEGYPAAPAIPAGVAVGGIRIADVN